LVFLQIGSESSFRVPKEPTAVWWASRPLNTPRRHHSSRSTHFWNFLFFRTRKNPGNLQEKDLTRYCGVLKDPPPHWWTCRLLRTPRYPHSSWLTSGMPSYQFTFCLNGKFPGNLQEKRILPLFSELEYSLEHSGGYPYYSGHPASHIPSREVRIFSRRCPSVLCRARWPTPGTPHPPLPTPIRTIQRLLGQPSQMNNWWHSSKNRLLQNGSLIHVTVLYFINGRLGTYEILCPSRYLLEQSNIRRSLLRAALSPCIQQSPSRTRRSPKGGGALTNGRHRRHLADARHGHAVVDFLKSNKMSRIPVIWAKITY